MRVDKYLWAIRVFKTRSLASKACTSSLISINGKVVKPSRDIQVGDRIDVTKRPIIYSYKVVEILKNRVGAKLVPTYVKDVTTEEELEKLRVFELQWALNRDRGTGRPTKRDRRDLDEFYDV